MGIFFIPKQKCPSMSRASKHLIQSKIQTKRHRLRGGEKASRESQKQASKGIFFCGVPDVQTEHSPIDTGYKDYKHQEANPYRKFKQTKHS